MHTFAKQKCNTCLFNTLLLFFTYFVQNCKEEHYPSQLPFFGSGLVFQVHNTYVLLSFLSMTNFVWVLKLMKGQTTKRITSNKSINYISEAISQLGNPHSNHHEQKNTTIQSLSVMKNENKNKNRVSSEQTSKK